MVPKRRQTTYWRRENTQKNIYKIQITVKAWNLEICMILNEQVFNSKYIFSNWT
jgi:hypothetical protein